MTTISRRRIAAVAVALALVPASTGPAAAADDTLIVRDLPSRVRLVPGEHVRLALSTNRTTGYTWKATGGRPAAKVSAGRYVAPPDTGMVGVPGTTTWTITAIRPGTATVTVVATPPGTGRTSETVGTLTLIVMRP